MSFFCCPGMCPVPYVVPTPPLPATLFPHNNLLTILVTRNINNVCLFLKLLKSRQLWGSRYERHFHHFLCTCRMLGCSRLRQRSADNALDLPLVSWHGDFREQCCMPPPRARGAHGSPTILTWGKSQVDFYRFLMFHLLLTFAVRCGLDPSKVPAGDLGEGSGGEMFVGAFGFAMWIIELWFSP